MTVIIKALKTSSSYATQTKSENDLALDHQADDLINIANGGSRTINHGTSNEETIPIMICTSTKKLKSLIKKKLI